MNSQFTVLIDSCVFYQAPVRDLILQLATQGLFRARWSKKIQKEWMENLLKNRPDLKITQLERTCELMNNSVLDCLVDDFEGIISEMLPDENDQHVLAAAIKSQAQVIVTYNIKDFPKVILNKYGIEVQDPDTFLRYQMDIHLPSFLSCVKIVRARLKKPARTAQEYLFTLFHTLPQTVNILKSYSNLI